MTTQIQLFTAPTGAQLRTVTENGTTKVTGKGQQYLLNLFLPNK